MQTTHVLALTFVILILTAGALFFLGPRETLEPFGSASKKNPDPATLTQTEGEQRLRVNAAVRERVIEREVSEAPFRFDIEYIFNALSEVRTNSNGQLVIDNTTREQLEAAFSKLDGTINDKELRDIQELVELGLPGEAGLQAAKLIGDYYDYREIEKTFLSTSEGADLDSVSSNFEQLIALRRAHLGYETSEKLFSEEQRQNRFMIEAMKIQADETLSEEEKARAQAKLEQERTETNAAWQVRVEQFEIEKQHILEAQLDSTETQRQIAQLKDQHFSKDEQLKLAENLSP